MVKKLCVTQDCYDCAHDRHYKENLGYFDTVEEAEKVVEKALEYHPHSDCQITPVYLSQLKASLLRD